jgi:hypothetical protein
MKTSHIMSGCCWLPLMKPITGRPEQRLLDAREAAAQHADDEVIRVIRLRARWPAAVELLEQRDHPVRYRGQHITMSTGASVDRGHPRSLNPIAETDPILVQRGAKLA